MRGGAHKIVSRHPYTVALLQCVWSKSATYGYYYHRNTLRAETYHHEKRRLEHRQDRGVRKQKQIMRQFFWGGLSDRGGVH